MIELLAPAGTYESFLAAVENGANAVYMGGKLFNARANATNFDIKELEEIVKYAHLRNVKIHITMNTLLDDNEINDALKFASELYAIGVDALIVQDLGLAKVLHEYLPNLQIHASTQLSTHTLEGVNELAKIGFSRVVLARELSITEIENIVNNTNTEIEIFAHGALCVSYSGQCLMSSMIGDRSGNRGKCAQPCRLPYTLLKNDSEVGKGYLLSPKDLSTIEILNKLPNITSLKIEGRMKSPEYVATVISTYRKYLDLLNEKNNSSDYIALSKDKNTSSEHIALNKNEALSADYVVSSEDKNNLAQIFNRGGFSTGYLNGKLGKDMMCYEKPKNWGIYIGKVTSYDGKRYITLDDVSNINIGDGIEIWNNSNSSPSTIVSELINNKVGRISGDIHVGDKVYKTLDKALNQKMRESFTRGFVVQSPVDIKVTMHSNENVKVYIKQALKNNFFEYTSNIIPEKSEKQPLTFEKVKTQFEKTGNTPFKINEFSLELDNDLFIAVSTLNEIRRNAFAEYEKYFINENIKNNHIDKLNLPKINKVKRNITSVSVYFNILRKEYLNLKNVSDFYFNFKDALNNLDLIKKFNGKKYIVLPNVTKSNYANLIKKNINKISKFVDGFVLSNIGQIEYFENIDKPLIANYTFNTFNTYTLKLLKELGFKKAICSVELTASQINSLGEDIDLEIIAYGNTCVMTSEYCPVGSIVGGFSENKKCSMPCIKNDVYYLKDRMNMKFRVIPDNIDCQSRIYNSKITSIETKNLNVNSIRIDLIDEDLKEAQKVIDTHISGKKLSGDEYTNGHINRPV